MKLILVLAAAIAVVYCEETYKTKFDNIDADTIIKNERLLQNHFNCLLEGKNCTPEDEELKKHLPEIIQTCCAKCSEKHKAEAKKMTTFLIENKPDWVKKLLSKYDPDGKYKENCAEQIKASGIDISQF
ncbi:hypothetical protein HHI36_011796 [Cryptolaemus montrouzieri]|uniref:Chemosensory protein n=1 Tax=Cryptolaemus montrouzieri TaxID=559131 RepID=A0ABD2NCN4_9CUCU